MPVDSPGTDTLRAALAALRDVIIAGERYRQVIADRLGISLNETAAVSFLYTDGPAGQTELARELNITTSSTTTLIDRLQARALAERVAHPVDRRRYFVQLTDQGRRVFEDSLILFRHALDHIPPQDLAVVTRSLQSIADDLLRQVDGEPA